MRFALLLFLTITIGIVSCRNKGTSSSDLAYERNDSIPEIFPDSLYELQIKLKSQQGNLPDCEFAKINAKKDYKNNIYSLHSHESIPVENTFHDVLRIQYNIMWRFTNDLFSDEYYKCYDSVMTELLKSKNGKNFLFVAQHIADSLDKTGMWRRDPSFNGGELALKKYLVGIRGTISNKFPFLELDKMNIAVEVEIDTLGNLIEPMILRGINSEVDSITCKLICQMPKWNPAYDCGKPCRSKYCLAF